MKRRLALFALVSGVVSACSSGSSSSSGSPGSSGSSGNPDCSFSGSLTGGVTGTIHADGCGTGTSASFSIAEIDLTTSTSLGVKFDLVTPLKGGELGAIPLQRFEVFQRDSKGGTTLTWGSTSCTLTLDKNVAAPTSVFTNRFLLAGRGSCSAPLDPTAPNTRPAVTVTPFEMTAFVDPR